jgi:hypothetical protein
MTGTSSAVGGAAQKGIYQEAKSEGPELLGCRARSHGPLDFLYEEASQFDFIKCLFLECEPREPCHRVPRGRSRRTASAFYYSSIALPASPTPNRYSAPANPASPPLSLNA